MARPEDEPPYVALVAVLRETTGQFTIDVGRRRLMARVAREGDNLIVHHRAVIMRRFEEAVTAEITPRASVEPDDLATGAAVAVLLAAYGSAVRHWILSDSERPFGSMVDTALGAAQQALAGTRAGGSSVACRFAWSPNRMTSATFRPQRGEGPLCVEWARLRPSAIGPGRKPKGSRNSSRP